MTTRKPIGPEAKRANFLAKQAAVAALRSRGISASTGEQTGAIKLLCSRVFSAPQPWESTREFFERVAADAQGVIQRTKYRGQIAPPSTIDLIRRDPWIPPVHLRQAEIDAHPRQIGVHAAGTGLAQ